MRTGIIAAIFAISMAFALTGCAGTAEHIDGEPLRVSLVAPGAQLNLLSDEFQGTEGPTSDLEGNVYFSQMFANSITRWSWEDNSFQVIRQNLETPNGLKFDASGGLLIAEMAGGRLLRDDLNGNISVVADSYDNQPFANPNDIWVAPDGGIYLTVFSMAAGPSGESSPNEGELLGVFYIDEDSGRVTLVEDDISAPNGIIGSPDGSTLYLGDNGEGIVWSYAIQSDGSLSDKQVFTQGITDGMTVDEFGNVYLTHEDVLVYSPQGQLILTIDMPQGASNVEFAGPDSKTLFITYHESVYTLEMAVSGAHASFQ